MQRQPRLGDILDDYCPRERRLTNHAVVAMIGDVVKQTRCVTCDAEHEYKHAKVPRQRRKDTPASLQAQVLASGPKKVTPEPPGSDRLDDLGPVPLAPDAAAPLTIEAVRRALAVPGSPLFRATDARPPEPVASVAPPRYATEGRADDADDEAAEPQEARHESDGPAHRRLIRATLPRLDGQPPATRPAPDFTIRTPSGGRPHRFRPRQPRAGGPAASGNRPGQGGNSARGGSTRSGNNRPPQSPRQARRVDGRKRSK